MIGKRSGAWHQVDPNRLCVPNATLSWTNQWSCVDDTVGGSLWTKVFRTWLSWPPSTRYVALLSQQWKMMRVGWLLLIGSTERCTRRTDSESVAYTALQCSLGGLSEDILRLDSVKSRLSLPLHRCYLRMSTLKLSTHTPFFSFLRISEFSSSPDSVMLKIAILGWSSSS